MYAVDITIGYIIAGLVVGFVVGMTGVGGGSLMTPILLYFGISPSTAVGTDLLYAAITKGNGVFVHQKKKNIDWQVTRLLAYGSLPAACVTLIIVNFLQVKKGAHADDVITATLGITLFFTAFAILFKQALVDWSHRRNAIFTRMDARQREITTVCIGVLLGVIVTITSIGAGAIGTMALFLIYPLLPTSRLVGTEIAHAVPLTLIAGLGHAGLGNVNFELLINLLIGSLPGIWIGSHMTGRVPDKFLRSSLAVMLIYASGSLLYKLV